MFNNCSTTDIQIAGNYLWTNLCVSLWFHQEYGGLDGLSMPDVVDLVEQSKDSLDDVWRQTDFDPYPETRMVRLMDVIGGLTRTQTKN